MTKIIAADGQGPRLIKARRETQQDGQALALACTQLAAALDHEVRRRRSASREFLDAVCEVACAMTRELVGGALASSPEVLLELMRPLASALTCATALRIVAHPQDAAVLMAHLAAHMSQDEWSSIHIEEDSKLSRGSLLVDSDVGALDGRLETRLSLMARELVNSAGGGT